MHLVLLHCCRQRQGLTVVAALALIAASVTAAYAEFVGECSENPVNLTEPLKDEILRHGVCEPYRGMAVLCDPLLEINVDYVYIPFSRVFGRQEELISQVNFGIVILESIPDKCKEVARKLVCKFFFIPCGKNGTLVSPQAICEDECTYLSVDLCPNEWELAVQHFARQPILDQLGLSWVNCSNPGKILEPLPHCCSDLLTLTNQNITGQTNTSLPINIIIASTVGGGGLLLVAIAVLVVILCLCRVRSHNHPSNTPHMHLEKSKFIGQNTYQGNIPRVMVEDTTMGDRTDGVTLLGPNQIGVILRHPQDQKESALARVPSMYIRQMSGRLLIPHEQLQLMDCIGQGEFGVVYRAKWTPKRGEMAEIVAVKTLKALFNQKDIDLLMEESVTMMSFNHCNVLNLLGVCIDNGPVPLLVLPFMANGSLLKYLKRERPKLTVTMNSDTSLIDETRRKLLSMCLQIAKGMEYLAAQKFVHRDLAARNCMIDEHGLIKVADFGLSEDIYLRNYFRQGREENAVKLPVKWMALESLQDGVFAEKTDVWSFGVVCWEIFSLGRVPYPGLDPISVVKHLAEGNRLTKPFNAACSEEIFSLTLNCWTEVIDERPTFSDLVNDISCILESVAGYMDFNFIQMEAGKEMMPNSNDHLESVAPHQVAASVQEEETAHSCSNAEESEESDNKLMVARQAYDHAP